MEDDDEPSVTAIEAFSAFANSADLELAASGRSEPKSVPPSRITEAALPEGFLGGGGQ